MKDDTVFPHDSIRYGCEKCGVDTTIIIQSEGITKRELAAMFAMQGLLSIDNYPVGQVAKVAVKCADSLFEELEKKA